MKSEKATAVRVFRSGGWTTVTSGTRCIFRYGWYSSYAELDTEDDFGFRPTIRVRKINK